MGLGSDMFSTFFFFFFFIYLSACGKMENNQFKDHFKSALIFFPRSDYFLLTGEDFYKYFKVFDYNFEMK